MKVNIVWDDKQTYGGGNQFLKRLRRIFEDKGLYANVSKADVILYNSHHQISDVKQIKIRYPDKLFMHRIDGPMRLYNNVTDTRDDIVIGVNSVADGIIFQSSWSKNESIQMYPSLSMKPSTVIHNACEFQKRKRNYEGKKKIVAISMSDNINKGYKLYSYLDDKLDFNRYEFTFVGRSPVLWKNISNLGLKAPNEIISVLYENDVFITASKNDPCSNSLIEALSVGLPAVALNSGGHPEIVKRGGEVFDGETDVIEKLNKVFFDIETYSKNITVNSIDDVAEQYLDFFKGMK